MAKKTAKSTREKVYRIDFATGNKWVSSLEWAKRVIDSVLKHQ